MPKNDQKLVTKGIITQQQLDGKKWLNNKNLNNLLEDKGIQQLLLEEKITFEELAHVCDNPKHSIDVVRIVKGKVKEDAIFEIIYKQRRDEVEQLKQQMDTNPFLNKLIKDNREGIASFLRKEIIQGRGRAAKYKITLEDLKIDNYLNFLSLYRHLENIGRHHKINVEPLIIKQLVQVPQLRISTRDLLALKFIGWLFISEVITLEQLNQLSDNSQKALAQISDGVLKMYPEYTQDEFFMRDYDNINTKRRKSIADLIKDNTFSIEQFSEFNRNHIKALEDQKIVQKLQNHELSITDFIANYYYEPKIQAVIGDFFRGENSKINLDKMLQHTSQLNSGQLQDLSDLIENKIIITIEQFPLLNNFANEWQIKAMVDPQVRYLLLKKKITNDDIFQITQEEQIIELRNKSLILMTEIGGVLIQQPKQEQKNDKKLIDNTFNFCAKKDGHFFHQRCCEQEPNLMVLPLKLASDEYFNDLWEQQYGDIDVTPLNKALMCISCFDFKMAGKILHVNTEKQIPNIDRSKLTNEEVEILSRNRSFALAVILANNKNFKDLNIAHINIYNPVADNGIQLYTVSITISSGELYLLDPFYMQVFKLSDGDNKPRIDEAKDMRSFYEKHLIPGYGRSLCLDYQYPEKKSGLTSVYEPITRIPETLIEGMSSDDVLSAEYEEKCGEQDLKHTCVINLAYMDIVAKTITTETKLQDDGIMKTNIANCYQPEALEKWMKSSKLEPCLNIPIQAVFLDPNHTEKLLRTALYVNHQNKKDLIHDANDIPNVTGKDDLSLIRLTDEQIADKYEQEKHARTV